MKKRKIILASLFFLVGIILISVGIFLTFQNSGNEELKKEDHSYINKNKNTRYFTCTRETFKMRNYTIDYQYDFSFINGEVKDVSILYIYTFKTKESYDLFSINFSDLGLQAEEEFDKEKLTKKYTTHVDVEEYANDVDKYKSYVQENGYICKEIDSKE